MICEKKPRNILPLDDLDDLDLSSWVAVGQGGRQHRRALVKLDELARIQREHGELIDSQLGGYFVGLGPGVSFFLRHICFVSEAFSHRLAGKQLEPRCFLQFGVVILVICCFWGSIYCKVTNKLS